MLCHITNIWQNKYALAATVLETDSSHIHSLWLLWLCNRHIVLAATVKIRAAYVRVPHALYYIRLAAVARLPSARGV